MLDPSELRLNLGEIALNQLLPVQSKRLPKVDNKFDAGYAQATIIPDKGFKVVYTKERKAVEDYGDLPELELSSADEAVVEAQRKKLAANPRFTDGDHILVKEINYDQTTNVVYLESVRSKYAVLTCIQGKLFDKSSPLCTTTLWRHGVISPYVTKDKCTYAMERSADKFFSGAAGFAQPPKGEGDSKSHEDDSTQKREGVVKRPINFSEGDMIVRQGEQESSEEFLWDGDKKSRLKVVKIENRAVSFRRIGESMPVLEFITPIELDCTASQLETVLATNAAPDKHEHTDKRVMLNLNPDTIVTNYSTNLRGRSGIFLYEPMVQAAVTYAHPIEAPKLLPAMNFCGTVKYMSELKGGSSDKGRE